MQKTLVYRVCVGLGLLVLISIPTFVPALHELLHYHSHLHCTATDNDVHLHEDIPDCELCKYLTTFTYFNEAENVYINPDKPTTFTPFIVNDAIATRATGSCYLRGPPVEFV